MYYTYYIVSRTWGSTRSRCSSSARSAPRSGGQGSLNHSTNRTISNINRTTHNKHNSDNDDRAVLSGYLSNTRFLQKWRTM